MKPLSILDPELSASVQHTLLTISNADISTAGKHSITAAQLKAMALPANRFRNLVTAGVAAVTNGQGGSVV